ncbi:MAG: glycine cleavage system aminomethyltransferase GcvT [Alphaproteobacteria bacterium]
MADDALNRTPLHDLHVAHGARIGPFAGYAMPIQYAGGIIREHAQVRESAGLFDVSHMGQVSIAGPDSGALIAALERVMTADLQALADGRTRYALLTNAQGGIRDDLMITRRDAGFFAVVNAANKHADLAILQQALAGVGSATMHDDRALVALQGPKAASVLARLAPGIEAMTFMSFRAVDIAGVPCLATRSGYTGEDGFEISVPAATAVAFCEALLSQDEAGLAGLGARDSLRLEAGLCLHGSDIDETTTPVEADLVWAITKRRRAEGGFPGAPVIQAQLRDGPPRKRVGIKPEGRAPARAHTEIRLPGGPAIGEVTSGGFGPTVGGPVAMGYVAAAHAVPGTAVELVVRDKPQPAAVVALPFTPHRYFRG